MGICERASGRHCRHRQRRSRKPGHRNSIMSPPPPVHWPGGRRLRAPRDFSRPARIRRAASPVVGWRGRSPARPTRRPNLHAPSHRHDRRRPRPRRRRPLPGFAAVTADRHRRRRADVSIEEHRRERGQFQGPHHAGRRREGRRPGRHAGRPRSLHRVRAGQQGVRQAARRHRDDAAEAREQGHAGRRAHLSRRRRQVLGA